MTDLTLTIRGPRRRVPASALASVLTETLGILDELQATHAPGHPLTWYLTGLRIGSAQAVLTAEDISTDAFTIGSEFVRALDVVEMGQSLPEYFSVKSLKGLKRLAKPFGTPEVEYLEASVKSDEGSVSAKATAKIGENLRKLQTPRSSALGSITGYLDLISTRNKNKFELRDPVSKRPVSCTFTDDQLEEIKGALKHRIVVRGMVVRNASGQPLRVDDAEFEVMAEAPPLTSLVGIDQGFIGGLSLPEYWDRVGS
jgi:hypothetical protein